MFAIGIDLLIDDLELKRRAGPEGSEKRSQESRQ
jgi:hypothetical protein